MNDFYSIAEFNKPVNHNYQLTNLGEKVIQFAYGTKDSHHRAYRTTTVDDYDKHFINKLITIKPPYDLPNFLDYHFNNYLTNTMNGNADTFIKHMKYVVLPVLKKRNNKEVYIDLLNEWISKHDTSMKNNTTNNVINFNGDINAPTQLLQGTNNSSQTQNITYSSEQIKELFTLLNKDIESLNSSSSDDLKTEMEYASKQIDKGRDIKQQLLNIGGLVKDIGINAFANLIASPIYELVKPYLGL